MNVWKVTRADRDEAGKIKIGRSLSDLLPATTVEDTAAPVSRRRERDAAMLVSGVLVGVALFALIGRSSPAPAAPRAPLAVPTALPTATTTMTATPAPTVMPQPTATAVPTEAPALFAPPPTPCDILTAPFQVKQQVFPIGSVVGVSCESAEEAQANADALADAMRATATAEAR
jgi:hypothetical protein